MLIQRCLNLQTWLCGFYRRPCIIHGDLWALSVMSWGQSCRECCCICGSDWTYLSVISRQPYQPCTSQRGRAVCFQTYNLSFLYSWIFSTMPYQACYPYFWSYLLLPFFLFFIKRYTQLVPNNNTNTTKMRMQQPNVIIMQAQSQSPPSVSHYRGSDHRPAYPVSISTAKI